MRTVSKPWGHEEIWAETDRYVGKTLHIKGGHRLSRQFHRKKDETIRVLSGILTLEIGRDDNIRRDILMEGTDFRILPGTVHRFCAERDDVVLIEVSTPELDDVVRLEDDYVR